MITKNSFTYNQEDQIGAELIQFNEAMPAFMTGLTTYNYNTINQMLSSNNPNQSFAYDLEGNMTQGYTPEGYIYTASYDAENRLSSIVYSDSSNTVHKTEFVYNVYNLFVSFKSYGASQMSVNFSEC